MEQNLCVRTRALSRGISFSRSRYGLAKSDSRGEGQGRGDFMLGLNSSPGPSMSIQSVFVEKKGRCDDTQNNPGTTYYVEKSHQPMCL